MNIPNILTVIRFLIIPFFGYFLYGQQYVLAGSLFLLGGITDVLDGYIARKFNLVTAFGKLADPAADKLMQVTALVLLTLQDKIPNFILILVIAKEVFMGVGTLLLYKQAKHVVSAHWYGKLATVVFYFAVIAIIFFDMREPYSGIFMGVAIVPTMFAFIMYSRTYRQIRQDSRQRNV